MQCDVCGEEDCTRGHVAGWSPPSEPAPGGNVTCIDCNGAGTRLTPASERVDCSVCSGSGIIPAHKPPDSGGTHMLCVYCGADKCAAHVTSRKLACLDCGREIVTCENLQKTPQCLECGGNTRVLVATVKKAPPPPPEPTENARHVGDYSCLLCGNTWSSIGGKFTVCGCGTPGQPAAEFKKDDAGKPRYSLVPPEALHAVAELMTHGAIKYDDHNYRKGANWNRYFDAAQRHLNAWQRGEDIDLDSGFNHLDNATCCLMILSSLVKTNTGKDDRYRGDP